MMSIQITWDAPDAPGGYHYEFVHIASSYVQSDEDIAQGRARHERDVVTHDGMARTAQREGAGHIGAGWLGNQMLFRNQELGIRANEAAKQFLVEASLWPKTTHFSNEADALNEIRRIGELGIKVKVLLDPAGDTARIVPL